METLNYSLKLKVINPIEISKYLVDFQKHSRCYELPTEESQCIGAYFNDALVGFFIIIEYIDKTVDITHGYLLPKYRHLNMTKQYMNLLSTTLKSLGIKKISLCTNNRFKSYIDFMDKLGYKPKKLIFSKEI